MKNLEVIKYSNIFPADVPREGHLVLGLLYFSCPFHRTSLLLLTRPFMGEEEAAALLRQLTDKGYLKKTETGMGSFFSLTARSMSYMDVEKTQKPYRSQKVAERMYLTYYLQSYIAANHLVLKCLPAIGKDGLLPRSIDGKYEIISGMIREIMNGTVPFVDGYNSRLYKTIKHPIIQSLYIYEKTAERISALSSKMNAARIRAKNDPKVMSEYTALHNMLCGLRRDLEEARRRAVILTASHGAKVLTLQNFGLNGIFIEEVKEDAIVFGVLNNCVYGISPRKLRERMDYITSFAEHIGVDFSVHVYITEECWPMMRKILAKDASDPANKLVCLPVPKSIFSRKELRQAIQMSGGDETVLKQIMLPNNEWSSIGLHGKENSSIIN